MKIQLATVPISELLLLAFPATLVSKLLLRPLKLAFPCHRIHRYLLTAPDPQTLSLSVSDLLREQTQLTEDEQGLGQESTQERLARCI